jgi:hypothetical protein
MAGRDADERVADTILRAISLQERMPAVASVLGEPVALHDLVHAMTEQAAEVPHFLFESRFGCIRIAVGNEQERVPALDTSVFVMTVAFGHPNVRVMAKKTGQRVAHARAGSVGPEVRIPASADAGCSLPATEDVVVDVMSP